MRPAYHANHGRETESAAACGFRFEGPAERRKSDSRAEKAFGAGGSCDVRPEQGDRAVTARDRTTNYEPRSRNRPGLSLLRLPASAIQSGHEQKAAEERTCLAV